MSHIRDNKKAFGSFPEAFEISWKSRYSISEYDILFYRMESILKKGVKRGYNR